MGEPFFLLAGWCCRDRRTAVPGRPPLWSACV